MRSAAWFLSLSLVLLAGCVLPAPHYRVRQVKPAGLSAQEVVRLSKSGVSESVVIEKIKTEGVAARPSADEVVSLKNEGVSEAVLSAMLAAPVVPERTVEVVYDDPYSYPYYYGYGYSPYYYGYYGYPYGYGYPYWGYSYYHPYRYYGSYPARHATSVHTYRR